MLKMAPRFSFLIQIALNYQSVTLDHRLDLGRSHYNDNNMVLFISVFVFFLCYFREAINIYVYIFDVSKILPFAIRSA